MAESELFSFLYLWKKWKKFVLPFAIFLVQNESTAQTCARPTLKFCSRLCFVHYFDSWPKLIIPLITRVEGEGGLSPHHPSPPLSLESLLPSLAVHDKMQHTITLTNAVCLNPPTLHPPNQWHTNKHSSCCGWCSLPPIQHPTHIKTRHHTLLLLMPTTCTFSLGSLPASHLSSPPQTVPTLASALASLITLGKAGEWKLTIIITIYIIIFMFPIIPLACLVLCTDDVGIAI